MRNNKEGKNKETSCYIKEKMLWIDERKRTKHRFKAGRKKNQKGTKKEDRIKRIRKG